MPIHRTLGYGSLKIKVLLQQEGLMISHIHDSGAVPEEDETGTSSDTDEESLQGMHGQEKNPMSYGRWTSRDPIREMGGPCGD